MTDMGTKKNELPQAGVEGKSTWTISVAGISEVSGLLVQASHTVENGDLKMAMQGLSQITEMFKERKVGPLASALAETLGGSVAAAIEPALRSAVPAVVNQDVVKPVKVMSLKLMFTDNGNPYLNVKAQPGLMKHGLNAWPECWQHILGDDKEVMSKFGVGKDIPVPTSMQFAWAAYKGSIAQKVIGFTDSPTPEDG